MGYVGNQQTEGFSQVPAKQDLTGATGTSLTLTHAVASAEGIDLFINNVRQESGEAYSIGGDGVTVTLTGSVVASDDIYVVYNSLARQTSTHPSNQALQATSGTFSGTVTANAFAGDGSSLTGVGVAGIASSSTSGTALSIDANNFITTPARPAFRVQKTGSTTLTAGALETVDWDATDFDIGSNFNLSTNAFTAPVSGLYLFSANLSYYDNGNSRQIEGRLRVNSSQTQTADAFIQQTQSNNTHMTITLTALLNLTANDVVDVQTVSVGTITFYSSGNRNFFHGYLVG